MATVVPHSVDPVVTLVEGSLDGLCHEYALDGTVSTHGPAVSGTASMNSYLLREDDGALLVDAGMTVHGRAQVSALRRLLGGDRPLAILPTRSSEFHPVANVRSIAQALPVDRVFGTVGDALEWADFHPNSSTDAGHDRGWTRQITACHVAVGDQLAVGGSGRCLEVVRAPLRLLPTLWGYDSATGALFTADVFTAPAAEGPRGVCVIDDPAGVAGAEELCRHLLGARYWWLAGARTAGLQAELLELFACRDVTVIAPAYGPIVQGRAAVQRALAAMLEALELAAGMTPVGVR